MTQLSSAEVWSALPTALNADLTVDAASTTRTIQDAIASAMRGVFIGGTCGEGPWLPDRERRRLIGFTRSAAGQRLHIAAQVTDNSVARVLDQIRAAQDAGADYALVAPPPVFLNPTADRIVRHFLVIAEASPLPLGIYDLGTHRPNMIPTGRLREVYAHPNVHFVKDSSGLPARRAEALAARAARPALRLFNGDEFSCLDHFLAGYDGVIFGGAAAVAPKLHRVVDLFSAGRLAEARIADAEMRRILHGIYGGETIACWLTGLKYYMVRRGLFSSTASFLEYPLTPDCRAFIERYVADTTPAA